MHNTLRSITGSALSVLSKGGQSVQDDDGFGGTLRRARARVPRADEALYAEGGEFENHPWWETPFLEPLSVDGKRTAHDKYSPDVPLWESVSHYALMSLAVRNLVKALERNAGGEKIGDSYVRVLTVTQLRAAAEKAMEKSLTDVAELKLKRMGEPRETTEHPTYVPVVHYSLGEDVDPFVCDVQHVDFTADDLLDIMRDRSKWLQRIKKRLRLVMDVSYWRTGRV